MPPPEPQPSAEDTAARPVAVGFDGARDADTADLVFVDDTGVARRYWLRDWIPARPADTPEAEHL